MAAPWGHEEADAEGDGEPVLGEEVLGGGFLERARLVWFNRSIDPDCEDDCDWVRETQV
jgi:hypothetical protein